MKLNTYLSQVYIYVFIGLLISGLTAYLTADLIESSLNFRKILYDLDPDGKPVSYSYLSWGLIFLNLVLAFLIGSPRLNTKQCGILYGLITFIFGVILSSIFILYKIESIYISLFGTASLFGIMSVFGYFTGIDLSKLRNILVIGIFIIIITSLINYFLIGSSLLSTAISGFSILVFMAFTAYDVYMMRQKKNLNEASMIRDAANLYLNFINIFINLLQLTGNNK